MRSTRDFLTGILTGVAIGILTAPRSGKETREKLMEEANKRSGDLKDQWEKGVSQAKDQFNNLKDQANQYVGQAKDQLNQAKDQFNQSKNQAQTDYNQQQMKADYNDKVDELADDAQVGISSAKESVKL
jgi:gas vesicle protein